jgi:hypothetical protein
LLQLGENVLDRMPIVRPIYKTVKQVFTMLFSKSGNSFRKVGLVEFPAPGMWSLVFLSQPPSEEIASRLPDSDDQISVFMPARRTRRPVSFSICRARTSSSSTSGRRRRDVARFGRYDSAGREWRSEEACVACRDSALRADGARGTRDPESPK